MVESVGLGVAAEVPAVVVDVMRAGPSTGIPSKTEQSDLNIAIYGGHGDAPRVVLAPISVSDCLLTAEWAVYVAESLQSPIDGYVIEGHVPAAIIRRLLTERPAAVGLAVPGMPVGSPGMEVPGAPDDPYNVFLFGPSGQRVYARYKGPQELT
jgi:2-oxoglutarate ferredoxin oxidoreductase subunit alpha